MNKPVQMLYDSCIFFFSPSVTVDERKAHLLTILSANKDDNIPVAAGEKRESLWKRIRGQWCVLSTLCVSFQGPKFERKAVALIDTFGVEFPLLTIDDLIKPL